MASTYQLSDKRGDAILVVKLEAPDNVDASVIYTRFVELLSEAGIQAAADAFDGTTQAAVAAAAPLVAPAAARAAESWGNPPVPAMAQPQVPAAAGGGKACDRHGIPMTYKSGETNGREWAFWGCNGPSNDRCEKVWAK